MGNEPKKVILGTVIGAIALSGSAFGAVKAYDKYVKVRFANIKLVVDGLTIQTKAEPFIYNGNVYAPVATVANGMGIAQKWNNSRPAVEFERKNLIDDSIQIRNHRAADLGLQNHMGETATGENIFLDTFLATTSEMGGGVEGLERIITGQRIVNTSNGTDAPLPLTTPNGEKLSERTLIKDSISNGMRWNEGKFAFLETSSKNERFITYYKYENSKLTKLDSVQIETGGIHGDLILYTKDGQAYTRSLSFYGDKIKLGDSVPVVTTKQ
ncbi:stalk domain-containing protein [Aneurinibacillus tyrosinisolvens]|uniref:stalk domain-containing protein n=1 Tax=Aneurinibacillus tyrosinisolvens TaxID=1443435 RepID=UPI00063F5621|nr:stalk domain-containing protein [Aneurinibacillus tyrosinisolvens]